MERLTATPLPTMTSKTVITEPTEPFVSKKIRIDDGTDATENELEWQLAFEEEQKQQQQQRCKNREFGIAGRLHGVPPYRMYSYLSKIDVSVMKGVSSAALNEARAYEHVEIQAELIMSYNTATIQQLIDSLVSKSILPACPCIVWMFATPPTWKSVIRTQIEYNTKVHRECTISDTAVRRDDVDGEIGDDVDEKCEANSTDTNNNNAEDGILIMDATTCFKIEHKNKLMKDLRLQPDTTYTVSITWVPGQALFKLRLVNDPSPTTMAP